jgi:hypothetical protein
VTRIMVMTVTREFNQCFENKEGGRREAFVQLMNVPLHVFLSYVVFDLICSFGMIIWNSFLLYVQLCIVCFRNLKKLANKALNHAYHNDHIHTKDLTNNTETGSS